MVIKYREIDWGKDWQNMSAIEKDNYIIYQHTNFKPFRKDPYVADEIFMRAVEVAYILEQKKNKSK